MKSAAPLALAWALGGCAGESFGLAEESGAAAQGGSAFSELDTTSAAGFDAGGVAGAGAGGAAGTGAAGAAGTGAAGAAGEPIASACGELRGAPGQDDLEACIAQGSFTMGNSEVSPPQAGEYVAHGPAHRVTLSAYVLDAYEVTVARYRACVDAGACTAPSSGGSGCTYTAQPGERERLPVTCVSWDDALSFCAWDGGRRLPTEAEWERAARGSDANRYPWGNDFSCNRAVLDSQQCATHVGSTPKAVGSAPLGVSAEGVFDLTGNAWEWVNDRPGPYPSTDVTDPTGPESGSTGRVFRGGNWQTPAANAAAFMRRAMDPQVVTAPTTFRCARSAAAE